jgi:hypothetical protein
MGLIKCETHGMTGIVLTCDHLSREIQGGIKLKKVITVSHEEFETFVLRYCSVCAAAYDFPLEDSKLPDEKFDSMQVSPSCYECFQELNN